MILEIGEGRAIGVQKWSPFFSFPCQHV